jgi:hypothetical protein
MRRFINLCLFSVIVSIGLVVLFGCGDDVRFTPKKCFDINGTEVPCA